MSSLSTETDVLHPPYNAYREQISVKYTGLTHRIWNQNLNLISYIYKEYIF